jgi:ribulose-5-phosphate 4-epimerase/fuculose-1-phosphate aldolase
LTTGKSEPAVPLPATSAADRGTATPAPDEALLDELVLANHILFDQGIVDAFGHVSVRHDKCSERFLMSRSLAPGQVTREALVEFDLEGNPIDAHGRAVYIERFIHGAIYAARPDVMAVVHSHSATVVPFSVVPEVKLRPVCHTCAFLGEGAPTFEIRDVAGQASDLLIRDNRLGAALAATLGGAAVVLMRGHGSTVVGQSLQHAVYRAVYTEVNAKAQAEALRLGAVVYLTTEEARTARESTDQHIHRPWNLWNAQLGRK